MILLKNIYKAWDGTPVLNNISLDIEEGKIFCLVGMSGSGKSVTTKLILGLEKQDSGQVIIDGKDTSGFSEVQWRETLGKFGVVFQNAALFSSLNVFENIGIRLLEEKRKPKPVIREMVADSLVKVGLKPEIMNKYPDELSGGMRKRVGIARAIIHKPKYLIYDEPTTGLDPVNANLIDKLILDIDLEEAGITSIVITHDFHTVAKLNSHIVMIHDHRIYFSGTTSAFMNSQDGVIRTFLSR
ncbi:MAG: ATP-binding cassette domain-containing protein [Bacteroidia bacterium]|nr:ATP-binding cassette domain-containing protein [Bacteroidia bacterium]